MYASIKVIDMRIKNEFGNIDLIIRNQKNGEWEYKTPGWRERSWCENQGFWYCAQEVRRRDGRLAGISFPVSENDIDEIPEGFRKLPHNLLWGSWEEDPCRRIWLPILGGLGPLSPDDPEFNAEAPDIITP